jgi:hypothetical protein
VKNLQNWVKGTASISRHESAYLDQDEDMANLTGAADSALVLIEDAMGDVVFCLGRCFRRVCDTLRNSRPCSNHPCQMFPTSCTKRGHKLTADEHISIMGPSMSIVCRALTTWLATIALMVPVIVLSNISSSSSRLTTIALSAGFFLTALSLFTRARTVEIFTAGARYAYAQSWNTQLQVC